MLRRLAAAVWAESYDGCYATRQAEAGQDSEDRVSFSMMQIDNH